MARESNRGQSTFFDTDYLCDLLVPENSFYRKFRVYVWLLIKDSHFEEMYCWDNGSPPISPKLLAMACILQFHRNLSDREMERACMYDIEIKFALGLRLDERPFDHSSRGDFRERLLKNKKEHETQRIDSTHVIADIAIPTVVSLVKKGIFEVLKHLAKTGPKAEVVLRKKIRSEEYTKEEVNHVDDGRLDLEKRKAKLVWIVNDARTVLKEIALLEHRERLSWLRRLVHLQQDACCSLDSCVVCRKTGPAVACFAKWLTGSGSVAHLLPA